MTKTQYKQKNPIQDLILFLAYIGPIPAKDLPENVKPRLFKKTYRSMPSFFKRGLCFLLQAVFISPQSTQILAIQK
ncbi:hypothetical protein HCUR_00003 [Holospora curviuscula]|uniref:Uncharacterized protein n=1 Tax=Holospora curviuscula TaxID=1082868 RepID=A0A2S5RHZ3_9PROT|nr:hypothetical protein HCUR_00003 [Holospora curviuscula]